MDYFSIPKLGRVFALRLDQGDFVIESIKEFISKENIRNAVVVSGIGTLDRCVLHMVTTIDDPSKMFFKRWEDYPLELASVDGIIADGVPHLHAVVSDTENTWAGHLEEGCRVLYLGEIVIIEFEGVDLTRVPKVKDSNDVYHLVKQLVEKE